MLDGVEALRRGDAKRFGELMSQAHVSFRDDFQASCEECDILAAIGQAVPGCYGSRLTGGGVGGCAATIDRLRSIYALHEAIDARCQS